MIHDLRPTQVMQYIDSPTSGIRHGIGFITTQSPPVIVDYDVDFAEGIGSRGCIPDNGDALGTAGYWFPHAIILEGIWMD